jgi:hypothetical protein
LPKITPGIHTGPERFIADTTAGISLPAHRRASAMPHNISPCSRISFAISGRLD